MKKTLLLIITLLITLTVLPVSTMASETPEAIEQETRAVVISQQDNALRIVGANGLDAKVYNLAGVCVMAFKVEGNDRHYDLNLRKGCYIVKVGNIARKIYVK